MNRSAQILGLVMVPFAVAACSSGSSEPTYSSAVKDHAVALKACQNALGTDQAKLALLDPGEIVESRYKVSGEWENNLTCTVTGSDFHNAMTFATTDESSPGDLTSHQGTLYSWVGADSGVDFDAKAQGVLDDVTKKLAG